MSKRPLDVLISITLLILIVSFNLTFDRFVMPHFRKDESENFRLFAKPDFEKWSAFEFRLVKAFYYTLSLRVYANQLMERYRKPTPLTHKAIIQTAEVVTKLCPHYFDIYYVANAYLTWDYKDFETANRLLTYAIEHNPQNYVYYFYLGFNYFYFLKDYQKGAEYLIKASEVSGNPKFAHLASRLLYASGRTEVALGVLRSVIEKVKDEGWKKHLQVRLKALEAIYFIERAVEEFRLKFNRSPKNLEELVKVGFLRYIPEDPYGGEFYIDEEGNVRTTSNLTYTK